MLRTFILTLILTSVAIAAQVVEGRVVNTATGAGIAGASVRLRPAGDSPDGNGYDATTDPDGRFRIDAVKDGTYRARYSAKGFISVPHPGGSLPPFAVAGRGEPVRLEIKLQPLGKLFGRVKDGAGNPVPNATVWFVRAEKWCKPPLCLPLRLQSKTNEKGEYFVENLDPGPWLLSAAAPPSWNPPESNGDERFGWAQTFYPGVTDPRLAEPVMLRTGGEQWNPDIKLTTITLHRVLGSVQDIHSHPVAKASVALDKDFGPGYKQDTKDDGTFEFNVIPKGEWRLSASVEDGGVKLRTSRFVEIKNDDLENVGLSLTAPFTLRGKLVTEVPDRATAPELPIVDFELSSDATLLSDPVKEAVLDFVPADGNLTVKNVYPGTYQVQILADSSAPYYLDSIRLGDRDAIGWVTIVSDAEPLVITFKLGGGTVQGNVEGCSAGHVFLIPREIPLRRAGLLRVTGCGEKGRFEFPAVRPGEYYGFAIAGDGSPGFHFADLIQDDDLLKQASTVKVRANESTSAGIRLIGR
jgi:hypothetical protein